MDQQQSLCVTPSKLIECADSQARLYAHLFWCQSLYGNTSFWPYQSETFVPHYTKVFPAPCASFADELLACIDAPTPAAPGFVASVQCEEGLSTTSESAFAPGHTNVASAPVPDHTIVLSIHVYDHAPITSAPVPTTPASDIAIT